jgi:hypothetical protein
VDLDGKRKADIIFQQDKERSAPSGLRPTLLFERGEGTVLFLRVFSYGRYAPVIAVHQHPKIRQVLTGIHQLCHIDLRPVQQGSGQG